MDIVDYLDSIDILPRKISGNNYWYLSPLRTEKTASFKVNRKLNRWKDFGTGEGSTLVDFGIRYYHCTISELLVKLSEPFLTGKIVPHKNLSVAPFTETSVRILDIYSIRSAGLIHYLRERRIAMNVAQKYCEEATYAIAARKYYGLCFKNNSGGV